MVRTPSLHPRSGLAGLGLILLVVLVVGALAYYFVAGSQLDARRAEASERGTRELPAASDASVPDEEGERRAPPVELVSAGSPAQPAADADAQALPGAPAALTAANEGDSESALALVEGQPKMEGPALKYQREGKAEVIKGKDQRRERRAERKERAAEAAALGVTPEKRALENPKKNVDRSQLKNEKAKGDRPPREKKDAPKDESGG